MRIRPQHIVLSIAFAMAPFSAEAKVSKDLQKELSTYVSELATSQDAQTRQAVAMTRGWIDGNKDARAALEPLKTDPKIRVRLGAAFGLMEARDRGADDFVVGQLKATDSLLPMLEEVVSIYPDKDEADILKDVLKGAKPPVARDVLRYLVSQEGRLWDLYEKTLLSGDHRKEAMQAALHSRRPELREAADEMLSSRDDKTRRDGALLAVALSEVPGGYAKAKPLLYEAAKDKSADVRTPAAERLLEMKDRKGAEALIGAMEGAEPAAQAATLTAIRDAGVSVDPAELASLKESEDETVKLLAYQVLAQDPDTKKEILENLNSTDFSKRLLALKVAGYTDSNEAAEYLAGSLFEGRPDVRRISAEGLALLGKPVALEALKRALAKEPDVETKIAVVEAIGAIGSKESVNILRFQSKSRNEKLKKAVVDALIATNRKDAVKALNFMTRERNAEIQWAAFVGMLELDYEEARKLFGTMFRNPEPGFLDSIDQLPEGIRERVYVHLLTENEGAPRDAAILTALKTGEFEDEIYQLAMSDDLLPKVRRQIILAMADRGAKKDIIVLENIARKSIRPDMAHLAAWMLTRRPNKELEATFRGLLTKGDPVLKGIATFALGYIND